MGYGSGSANVTFGGSVKNLLSIFIAYGLVWLLHVGYLLSLAVRQNSLRQEIDTLKSLIQQGEQTSFGHP